MKTRAGFTLIEVVLVIVIAGILGTVAMRSVSLIGESVRTEEAKQELEHLASAITGNPDLTSGGSRADFGYLGDIGALPSSLDALVTNPGYSTWNGPYVGNNFAQNPTDFKTDPWGTPYQLSGVNLTSTGSGSPIVRKLASSTSELLRNQVSGIILDLDGTPPGNVYHDSLTVRLTTPNGLGGTVTKTRTPDIGGYFSYDSIPIGNHSLQVIYHPDEDTLHRFVSVTPGSALYAEHVLAENYWSSTGGSPGGGGGSGLGIIAGSDTLTTANCYLLVFWITNSGSTPMTISSLTVSWTGSAAYYKDVYWDGVQVRSGNPPLGNGSIATFSSARTISAGESLQIRINEFHSNSNGGGPPVNMSGREITIEFSGASTITFTADNCVP